MKIGVLGDNPGEDFEVFLTPVLFNFFVFDHFIYPAGGHPHYGFVTDVVWDHFSGLVELAAMSHYVASQFRFAMLMKIFDELGEVLFGLTEGFVGKVGLLLLGWLSFHLWLL